MSYDTPQSSVPEGILQGNWNRDRCRRCPFLHDLIATALSHRFESVLRQNTADLKARKTRCLPNRYLDLGYEDIVVNAPGEFGRRSRFEKQR